MPPPFVRSFHPRSINALVKRFWLCTVLALLLLPLLLFFFSLLTVPELLLLLLLLALCLLDINLHWGVNRGDLP